MALATYTYTDSKSDPLSVTAIDTGVGSAPGQRAFTFQSNEADGKSQVAGNDYGVATTRSSRPRCFEEQQSRTISIDPGLGTNG